MHFEVETDHKPLVPILSSKHLDSLPPRVLRFRLRMARYDYSISHIAGKLLYTADALSRAPIPTEESSEELEGEVEQYVKGVVATLPVTESRLQQYEDAQTQDETCAQVKTYCQTEWPSRDSMPDSLLPYWKVRSSLTVYKSLLMYNDRIVIPKQLRRETMARIHEGHQGMERCRMRAKVSVWWPRISKDLTEMVSRCNVCARDVAMRKEPLMLIPLPDYPWQVLGSDLFSLKGAQYLVVVDYFSRYPEVIQLSSTVSGSIIVALKSIFARHGIPEVLRSDNGPQYISEEFARFTTTYGIRHITSSPRYPQSNGQAERTVQTVKRLIRRSKDPFCALLSYRATPLPWCNLSPAELLMGRRLRTTLPQTDNQLVPKWPFLPEFKRLNRDFKKRQKVDFDHRHRVRELPPIPDDSGVWVSTERDPIPGTVTSSASTPRSYIIDTPAGELRRNRGQLRVVPNSIETQQTHVPDTPPGDTPENPPCQIMTRSRSGVQLKPLA